jgi:hypothetical protein
VKVNYDTANVEYYRVLEILRGVGYVGPYSVEIEFTGLS